MMNVAELRIAPNSLIKNFMRWELGVERLETDDVAVTAIIILRERQLTRTALQALPCDEVP